MTREQLIAAYPNASESFLRANSASGAPSCAVAESPVCNASNGEAQGAQGHATRSMGRIKVSITSYRRRLIDPDNLCAKWFVDSLRYAGAIPDDREEDISLEVKQVKVPNKEAECTIIEIA